MTRVLYLDCFSGASGDMVLAALIDAGAPAELVAKQLEKLGVPGLELVTSAVQRAGVAATGVEIKADDAFSAGSFAELSVLIREAGLERAVEDLASKILRRLAEAEALVHGSTLDEVHFHEIAGADTIADVVGVAAALDLLEIDVVFASAPAAGSGTVQTRHGTMPVPPPAVLELMRGLPMRSSSAQEELLTPTGAAILATVVSKFRSMPSMSIGSVGYGAGQRETTSLNAVRAVVGDLLDREEPEGTEAIVLEANIDDMNPEFYEYVRQRLMACGAHDVWMSHVVGKEGRPTTVVSVLIPPEASAAAREVMFKETTTLGVRANVVRRWMLDREWVEVQVESHPVRVKVGRHGDAVVNVAPEYRDCAEVAGLTGLPVKEVFRRAHAAVVFAEGHG